MKIIIITIIIKMLYHFCWSLFFPSNETKTKPLLMNQEYEIPVAQRLLMKKNDLGDRAVVNDTLSQS